MFIKSEELEAAKTDEFVSSVQIHGYVREVYDWLVIDFSVKDTLKLLNRFLPLINDGKSKMVMASSMAKVIKGRVEDV